MKTKKGLAILLAVMMIASLFTGCGKKGEEKTGNNPTTPTTKDGDSTDTGEEPTELASKDPITFTFYNADGKENPWSDPVAQKITEITGVTLETDYPVDGTDQRVALMIASEEYPDMIFAKGDGDALIEAGALIDLTPLIDQYGPNIKKLYGDYYNRLRYSEEDQGIYQLSQAGVGNIPFTSSGTAQLQFDVLAANDYKVPKTLAEYEKYIKDYMVANPQIDGMDTIGISLSASDWHWYITLANPSGFIANASPDNGQWIINDANNYQATYKHAADGQKEYYQWLNRMYNEGVLDPDFATQTHDDYIAKVSSGRVLALMDANWDYADAERVLKADGKYNRTYAGLPVTMRADQKAPSLADQGLTIGQGVGITTACEDPVRAIQFIDWMCTDEAQVFTNWGIEGVNYLIDENGMRYRTEEEIKKANEDVNYKKESGVGFHNYPWPAHGNGVEDATGNTYTTQSKVSIIAQYTEAEQAAVNAWGVEMLTDIFPQPDDFNIIPYSPVWAQSMPPEFNDYATVLDEVAWPGLISCVICPESEFEAKWQQLQDKMKSVGIEEANGMLTEIIQKQVAFWSQN